MKTYICEVYGDPGMVSFKCVADNEGVAEAYASGVAYSMTQASSGYWYVQGVAELEQEG